MNVSLICACKNRYDALIVSLNSWLRFKEIKEFIIVDWSSDEPIDHIVNLDSRIKVIRVSDKKYFNQPQPLNLAASIATGDYILKVDTDYIINPYFNFFEKYFPGEDSFTSGAHKYDNNPEYYSEEFQTFVIDKVRMSDEELGNYFNSYSPFFKYLTGLLFISKENFNKVGGYNEVLGKCYAYEDEEIIKRIKLLGLKENRLDFDYHLIHIPHQDKKRFENFEGSSDDQVYCDAVRNKLNYIRNEDELQWQVEYALAQQHVKHNKQLIGEIVDSYVEPKTKWNIQKIDPQRYKAMEYSSVEKLQEFPTAYCVSLDESVRRREVIENQFGEYKLPLNFILSERFAESNDVVTGKYVHTLNDGTKGCCVSHLKAIKQWYETTDEDYGFFCEDDLSLETVEYWDFTWEEFIESIPEDAECVQLFTIRSEYDTFKLRERHWDDWGATAYILTRGLAKKIIDAFIKEDHYLLEVPNQEIMPLIENLLFSSLGKCYTIPLFVENIEFTSTFENQDDDVAEGHKTNHRKAKELVLAYWKGESNQIEKTELEQLLYDYSLDTENPEHNFKLGVWYENNGHTAPALSYFLRCAERGAESHKTLAYESLIRASYCYDKQGTRDGSARSLLWQAQMFLPNRPEAYFLLARFAERREWWQDCYSTCELALLHCDFDLPSLITDVEYPGKQGLLFEKAMSGWWWGKVDESRDILTQMLKDYDLAESDKKMVIDSLASMGVTNV